MATTIDNKKIEIKSELTSPDGKLFLAKLKTGRYYIITPNNAIVGTCGFTSLPKAMTFMDKLGATPAAKKTKTAKPASKPAAKPAKTEKAEPKKLTNLHKIKYGKSMDKETLKALTEEIWKGRFKLTNIIFENSHYWKATIEEISTGNKAESYRLDYFLSYERLPRALSGGT